MHLPSPDHWLCWATLIGYEHGSAGRIPINLTMPARTVLTDPESSDTEREWARVLLGDEAIIC